MLRVLLAVGAVLALAAAGHADEWAGQAERLQRPDGGEIFYRLDLGADETPSPLVLMAPGSGCLPVAGSASLAEVRAVFAGYAALAVEKRGVVPGVLPADAFAGCSEAFHAGHTVGAWVDDMQAVLISLAGASWWDGRVVLFGGSEGGLAMARLAPRVDADAAVLLATGGGLNFGEALLLNVPPEGQESVGASFAAIRAAPESAERFAGSSFRFWSDTLDRRMADDLLAGKTPVLLMQGGRDSPGNVAAARATADLFAASGHCGLSYREYPDLDHAMMGADGRNELKAVLTSAALWVEQQLASGAGCALP
jgi:alpha-beta hydrolase superfamily lysophospholipase